MNLKQKIKTLTLEEKAKHLLAEVPNEILDEKYTIAEFVDLPMGFAVWLGYDSGYAEGFIVSAQTGDKFHITQEDCQGEVYSEAELYLNETAVAMEHFVVQMTQTILGHLGVC